MKGHGTRPGKSRWFVLFLISLMYLITYLDRVNISTAAPVISKEFGFDKITMGVIFSAFVWSYAIFQIPGGWLGDRFGPRRVLTAIVTYWSAMTAFTSFGHRGAFVHGDPFSLRSGRSRRVSGRDPFHAALVSASRTRPGARRLP